jgi:uncharacterized protein YqeY
MRTVDEWKLLLRTALRAAQRARDAHAIAVIRETLAAIDNAEAPEITSAPTATSARIAGAAEGLGAGEVNRRALTPSEVKAIVEREQRERQEAAASYDTLGRGEEAAVLRRQVAVLAAIADPPRATS